MLFFHVFDGSRAISISLASLIAASVVVPLIVASALEPDLFRVTVSWQVGPRPVL
jgi:hypothetical protein